MKYTFFINYEKSNQKIPGFFRICRAKTEPSTRKLNPNYDIGRFKESPIMHASDATVSESLVFTVWEHVMKNKTFSSYNSQEKTRNASHAWCTFLMTLLYHGIGGLNGGPRYAETNL